MIEKIFNELKIFAEKMSHIESILIVGSYTIGTNKESSDLYSYHHIK